MTVVSGPVVDTSGEGNNGVLWARTGTWRSDGSILYAPQAKPYPIEAGQVSADLAPGPARLSIQTDGPPHTFHVTIPEQGPVALASLIGVP